MVCVPQTAYSIAFARNKTSSRLTKQSDHYEALCITYSNIKMTKEQSIKELSIIPGVGKSLATDLWNIGITSIVDLKGKDPNNLYERSNEFAGAVQDRCVLYVFKCAVYYANTPIEEQDTEKLKWWNWKDDKSVV